MDDNELLLICPQGREDPGSGRLEIVLAEACERSGVSVRRINTVEELRSADTRGRRLIFAVALSGAGVNFETYRLLEYFRSDSDCLEGSIGGVVIDGKGELFTKELARRLLFSANMAGCTFPGKPLVEATGELKNFFVLSGVYKKEPFEVYKDQVAALFRKVQAFEFPDGQKKLNLLALHASSRVTSNTLLLWDKIKENIGGRADISEISLRNGELADCSGCPYQQCLHFGEKDDCFYGGIMVEKVYPAVLACDAMMLICPNYNDAVSANITAFINRLTAIFRTHDFSSKRIYAIVVSGYSGGDIVAEQVLGAMSCNKNFILPGRFAIIETANDPKSILAVKDIDAKALAFAENIR